MVKKPEETVWIGVEYTCMEKDEYWSMEDKEFCQFAVNELEKIGIIDEEDVLDTHRAAAEGAGRPADLMRALCASRPAARFGQRRASGTSRGRKCAEEALLRRAGREATAKPPARARAGVDVFCGASLRQ